jgi:hypothetical protein
MSALESLLANLGLRSLGIASPAISARWCATGSALSINAANPFALENVAQPPAWITPAAGFLFCTGGAERLIAADGSFPAAAALLPTVYRLTPQTYLRLTRLFVKVIEGGQDGASPARPLPYFFAFSNLTSPAADCVAGDWDPGTALNIKGGQLTIHDQNGLPIDPVFVAAAFNALLNKYPELEARDPLQSVTPEASRQLKAITDLAGAAARLVHFAGPHGQPVVNADSLVDGITPLKAALGLYSVDANVTVLQRKSGASTDVRFGLGVSGTLSNTLTLPGLASGLTLSRDFFRILLADSKAFLLGEVDAAEVPVAVRHEETIKFSLSGQAAMGAANAIISGLPKPSPSLVVASEIHDDFAVPADGTDAVSKWPNFRGPGTSSAIPSNLRDTLAPTALFLKDSADVVLTLNGLTAGAAVRVYNRVFDEDAVETRGDGGGAVVDGSGIATLILTDPLGLNKAMPQASINYTLRADVRVTHNLSETKLYGNIACPVTISSISPTLASQSNSFLTADKIAFAPSELIGLEAPASTTLNMRASDQLPGMVRRESVVASKHGAAWQAQVSGARLVPAACNSLQRLGSPGCAGGPEYDTLAVQTMGGLLAYDLAVAAFRQSTEWNNAGKDQFKLTVWDPPPASTGGSISGAVLQTLGALASILPVPADLFTMWQQVNAGNSTEPPRIQQEIKRQYAVFQHGRRDALRALKPRIAEARELIYIEGPAFGPTGYKDGVIPDLVALLAQRLAQAPGLRVILCLPTDPEYAESFTEFQHQETHQRWQAVETLRAAAEDRVLPFHPLALPGRSLQLLTNLVLIDDVWAMVGTSNCRRRGMTFDGGLDLVLFDNKISSGRSDQVAALRRQRMSFHLGISGPLPGTTADANWVRLAEPTSAFWAFFEMLQAGGAGKILGLESQNESRPTLPPALLDPDGTG